MVMNIFRTSNINDFLYFISLAIYFFNLLKSPLMDIYDKLSSKILVLK